jgi:hypothetical protein
MGRQIEEIISSLGPLTGGTASINVNLGDIEALLTTLQADVADGIAVTNVAGVDLIRDGDGNIFGLERNFPVDGTVTANPIRATTGGTGPTTFTSTSYGTIAVANSARLGCQVFNEGAGNLHITLGTSTTSTSLYTVRLSSGDYFETPSNYTGLIGGIFATAGTARVTEVS